MHKKKDVLTTGQVAHICNVAPRTVTKWFDKGQLKGYRIPGSRDRRIPTSELIRFMKAHNMPTDSLEIGRMRILVIDSDFQAADQFAQEIHNKRGYEVETAQNSFDAGLVAHKLVPHVILINLMSRDIDATQVCRYVRTNDDLNATKVVAVAANMGENEIDALEKKGFDAVLCDTSDILNAIRKIEEVTSLLS